MAEIKINMDSLKSYRKAVRHKIKEGSNIFRFLPPFGEDCNGYPYVPWAIIWAHDPTTGNRRPYADCKRDEGRSPVWEYLDLLRAKVEDEKLKMLNSGASEEMIKDRFKATNKFISDIRPKTTFAWSAIDKAGTVGILELKTTAHKQVLSLMSQYIMDYNQDPTSLGSVPSDSGVWFNITRVGMNFDTEYSASKHQIMTKDPNTGVPSYTDDRSPIPESIASDYQSAGYDLTTIYQKKSYDELKDILVANITVLASANPDLAIDGFVAKSVTVSAPPVASVAQGITPDPKPSLPQGTGNIGIKLDNANDVTDGYEPALVQQETTQPSYASTNDDLMKMAEDIFNNQ